MKLLQKHKNSRTGALVILLVSMIGIAGNTIAIKYWSDANDAYSSIENSAQGYRATLLARTGVQAGITALSTIPEEYLYSSGMIQAPPDITIEDCKPICMVTYRMIPEDGKLNINHLVRHFDDSPNEQYRVTLERFFSMYNVPLDVIDSMIDWEDENNYRDGLGGESEYYGTLNPPRKIKNGQFYSLSEAGMVKGMEYDMLYGSRMPEGWLEQQNELTFQTEDEKNLITEDDWIAANNLTAYYLDDENKDDRVNINAARYHVLMSLSDSMTRDAVLEIFKIRRENNGYIKNVSELAAIPELQVDTPSGVTLYEELTGGGTGGKTGLIKTKASVYRVVGIGTIIPQSGDISKAIVRKVVALYDITNKRILYYAED